MTAPSTDRSIGQLVSDALEDVRSIVAHEKALAKAEVTRAAKRGGVGAGLLAAAAGLLGLALVFLLVAAAEALVDAGMTRWGAYLVVGGALLLLGVLLALVGVSALKKVRGPERAVEQGKGTVEDVKEAFSHDDAPATGTASGTAPRSGSGSTAATTTAATTTPAGTTGDTVVLPPDEPVAAPRTPTVPAGSTAASGSRGAGHRA